VAVDDEGRERLVAGQDRLDRLADRTHLRGVEIVLPVHRRVAGGEQQVVARAQRDLELLGQLEHELGARPCPPGLDEAEMPGGHVGGEREVELAEPSPPAPVAEHDADSRAAVGDGGHRWRR
jgi:hypothetical protein